MGLLMDKEETRKRIVEEARSWIGTPFHHEGRIKGVGVDCGMLLLEIMERAGLIPHIKPGHYSPDFMMHRNEEWYLQTILNYAVELEGPPYLPGDIVLFKHGRLFSHGALVIDYPLIVHAYAIAKCVLTANMEQDLKHREKKFFGLDSIAILVTHSSLWSMCIFAQCWAEMLNTWYLIMKVMGILLTKYFLTHTKRQLIAQPNEHSNNLLKTKVGRC